MKTGKWHKKSLEKFHCQLKWPRRLKTFNFDHETTPTSYIIWHVKITGWILIDVFHHHTVLCMNSKRIFLKLRSLTIQEFKNLRLVNFFFTEKNIELHSKYFAYLVIDATRFLFIKMKEFQVRTHWRCHFRKIPLQLNFCVSQQQLEQTADKFDKKLKHVV